MGVESLFLFYIAKKLVVVGDDQQISPYGVGIADAQRLRDFNNTIWTAFLITRTVRSEQLVR